MQIGWACCDYKRLPVRKPIAKLEKMFYNYSNWGCLDKKPQGKGENTMEFEAYCVKCRKKQKVKSGTVKEASNGRKMAQGTCPVCGTKVTRFLSTKKEG